MEKVLLHSCCAPCSAAILEWMGQNGYEPTILFYNSLMLRPLLRRHPRMDGAERL